MDFRLVDSGWSKELEIAISAGGSEIQIVCPFIKTKIAKRLLGGNPKTIQVITRFCLADFCNRVSDLDALEIMLKNGAQIRGVRNLHSKLYLFDKRRVIVTSANLTDAALSRNHEFGFVAQEPSILSSCLKYFEDLWANAGQDLVPTQIDNWRSKILSYLANGMGSRPLPALGDEGVQVKFAGEQIAVPAWASDVEQSFVKFFGDTQTRVDRSTSVIQQVERSGCHWACTYGKRPRQVRDGAIIFVSRLVRNPDDILVYGRVVGMQYHSGRDDATPAEIQSRPWKENWPYYIRVHHAEFIDGTLANGISLYQMMDHLKSNSYASTQRNMTKGTGNFDPRKAYLQQPAVELSSDGFEWLNQQIESAFAVHGKIPPGVLAQLDWPAVSDGIA
jgi:hypothetical protein